MVGQRFEQRARSGIDAVEPLRDHRRRGAVGFGEENIETDDRCARCHQPVDQFGEHGARPGPLSDLDDAGPVDIDDLHGILLDLARRELLHQIETAQPQRLDHDRILDAHPEQQSEQRQRHGAGEAETFAQIPERRLHRWPAPLPRETPNKSGPQYPADTGADLKVPARRRRPFRPWLAPGFPGFCIRSGPSGRRH
jgi:hypothetical protein